MAGPFSEHLPGVMISRFSVIKSGQPGKWHFIVELLAPSLTSVNDGISMLDSGKNRYCKCFSSHYRSP